MKKATTRQNRDAFKMLLIAFLILGAFIASGAGINYLALASATASETIEVPSTIEDMISSQALPSEKFHIPEDPRQIVVEIGTFRGFQTSTVTIIDGNSKLCDPRPTDIVSMERAVQIGMQYVWDIFNEDADGTYIEMTFVDLFSNSKTYWMGTIAVHAEDLGRDIYYNSASAEPWLTTGLYSFIVDAETGLRVEIFPWRDLQQGESYNQWLVRYEEEGFVQFETGEIVPVSEQDWMREWLEKNLDEQMAYLGLNKEDIEPYLEAAREFARTHFNNSELVYETEKFELSYGYMIRMPDSMLVRKMNNDRGVSFAGIRFTISDNTGREANIWVEAETFDLCALGIRTQHNDVNENFPNDRIGFGVG
ncbi:MAG: hypothetical protein FWC86_01605 [Coriobacteriia bacterium]|nr:hypothetical protein [Coriobacteriia bacterium]